MAVVDHVKRIIVPHLGVDEHTLPEALFRDGLAVRSLDALNSSMAFEDELDIDMSDKDAGTMDGFTTPSRTSSRM